MQQLSSSFLIEAGRIYVMLSAFEPLQPYNSLVERPKMSSSSSLSTRHESSEQRHECDGSAVETSKQSSFLGHIRGAKGTRPCFDGKVLLEGALKNCMRNLWDKEKKDTVKNNTVKEDKGNKDEANDNKGKKHEGTHDKKKKDKNKDEEEKKEKGKNISENINEEKNGLGKKERRKNEEGKKHGLKKDKEKKTEKSFIIWDLNPEAVYKRLNRQEKREMLRELANRKHYPKRTIEISSNSLPKELRTEKELSHAAILVLSLALKRDTKPARDSDDTNVFSTTDLFAELVGCADPETVEELSPYLRPPLITLKNLPAFIHCAVRQYVLYDRQINTPRRFHVESDSVLPRILT